MIFYYFVSLPNVQTPRPGASYPQRRLVLPTPPTRASCVSQNCRALGPVSKRCQTRTGGVLRVKLYGRFYNKKYFFFIVFEIKSPGLAVYTRPGFGLRVHLVFLVGADSRRYSLPLSCVLSSSLCGFKFTVTSRRFIRKRSYLTGFLSSLDGFPTLCGSA